MILRKARLTDFETYKILLKDRDSDSCPPFQWLYHDKTNTNTMSKEDIEAEWGDVLSIIEEYYENYTIEDFEKELKFYNIYMIESDDEILGYIKMANMGKGKYRIHEWSMFDEDDSMKKDVLEKLLKEKPTLQEILIYTSSKSAETTLIELGFVKLSRRDLYRLEVKKSEK